MQIVYARDWLTVEADDDVAFAHAAALGRTARLERDDEDAALARQIVMTHKSARQRHVLSGETDVAAAHAPVADQTTGDELRRVNRSGEADALRRADDGRRDADHKTARRDKRAARIARIQSRVRLDHVVHQTPRLRAQTPSERAHHTRCHSALKAVRVADGDDQLPDAHALRAAQLRGQ